VHDPLKEMEAAPPFALRSGESRLYTAGRRPVQFTLRTRSVVKVSRPLSAILEQLMFLEDFVLTMKVHECQLLRGEDLSFNKERRCLLSVSLIDFVQSHFYHAVLESERKMCISLLKLLKTCR
jgi:hypothetical protein